MFWTRGLVGLATCAALLTGCGSEYQPYTSAPETSQVPLEALLVRAGSNSTGSGTVVGSGIDCTLSGTTLSNTCAANFSRGNVATLKASATGGSTFLAWGDACASFGSSPTCTVTLSEALAVTASFAAAPPPPPPPPPPTYLVSVRAATSSTGAGTVTAVGINCTISGTAQSGDCSETLTQGAQLTLTATATGGGSFLGWSGACASAGVAATCTVTVNQALNVVASFAAPPKPPPPPTKYTVTVRAAATSGGNGTVTGSGISCTITASSSSGTCSASIDEGTRLVLTATPSGTSSFSGWGGACTGSGSGTTCTLSVSQNLIVDADFAPPPSYVVTVAAGSSGTGTGTVTGPGISCSISGASQGGDCSETVVRGTQVTLTSTGTGGSTFAGWSGACSGAATSGSCSFIVTAATSVGASFSAPPPPPNLAGFWSGSDAGVNIHYHVTLAQSGSTLSLASPCVAGDCRLTALSSTGSGWLNASYLDIVSLTGTASAASVTFTMNLGDRTVTFEGALTTPTRMVGQVSGPTMPAQSLTIDRQ